MTTRTVAQWLITAPQETFEAILDVTAERSRQEDKGWTPEHDDEHGIDHLIDEACRRLGRGLGSPATSVRPETPSREVLVKAAALLVAAIEAEGRDRGELAFASSYIPSDGSPPIVHHQRCWSCMTGDHFEPAQRHGWADGEDLAHAIETGQDVEAIKAQRCGCWCADESSTDADPSDGDPR